MSKREREKRNRPKIHDTYQYPSFAQRDRGCWCFGHCVDLCLYGSCLSGTRSRFARCSVRRDKRTYNAAHIDKRQCAFLRRVQALYRRFIAPSTVFTSSSSSSRVTKLTNSHQQPSGVDCSRTEIHNNQSSGNEHICTAGGDDTTSSRNHKRRHDFGPTVRHDTTSTTTSSTTSTTSTTAPATTAPARTVEGTEVTLGAGEFTGGTDVAPGLYDVTTSPGQSGGFIVSGTDSYNEILDSSGKPGSSRDPSPDIERRPDSDFWTFSGFLHSRFDAVRDDPKRRNPLCRDLDSRTRPWPG